MKKYLHKLFVVFLIIYALFIGVHLREIDWHIQSIVFFICGMVLALVAHARKNYITIVILLVHMGIEWFEWSHLRLQQVIWNCFHAIMDFTFLSHELKVHVRQYQKIILIGGLTILIMILFFGGSIPVELKTLSAIEPFVIGGVLGCILSHVYYHLQKE